VAIDLPVPLTPDLLVRIYELPDEVAVPARLRRASVMVRINSTWNGAGRMVAWNADRRILERRLGPWALTDDRSRLRRRQQVQRHCPVLERL
jgi:hypothetical protein